MDRKLINFILAIALLIIVFILPLNGLSYSGQATLALLIFAVFLWATETIPVVVTSVIVLFMQPLLGIATIENAMIGFANPILLLIIGGFVIAAGISSSGLVQRVAYLLISKIGTCPDKSVSATTYSTGFMSAWIENVVSFAMMVPILNYIIELTGISDKDKESSNFTRALFLGGSYASLAGGLATPIGTVPNLMASAYTGIQFSTWMVIGVPISLIMLFLIVKVVYKLFPPEITRVCADELELKRRIDEMGVITGKEKIAGGILIFTIFLWLSESLTGLNSSTVALIGATIYLLLGVITWNEAQKNINWSLVIFFGGALSLGAAMLNTGCAQWIINNILAALGGDPSPVILTLVLMVIGILFTQIMSNIALAAILIPISVSLADSTGVGAAVYAVPVAIACSLSFVLPVSDPTVAMAHSAGHVKVNDIMKAGSILAIIGIVITTLVMFTLGSWVL
ncbi:MAG TPA: DASS family sodium-coupled anion symporter [Methanobacteriaceae archaeon]|nr:DASS family sodium-coupled anion symporter [Methanobacteriaceae archaeon]